MNKTALKNFATWSRRKLIEQVQTKAYAYGIDEKNGLHIKEQFGQLLINEQTYPLSMKSAFTALQKQLEQKGYKQLVEEIAYTWFNRIIAIRYMEVHDFLPEKVNVLSSTVGRVDPDILFEYDTMDLEVDETKIRELINTGDTEAAFRHLFVAQCNELNTILPFMFERIQDYTELLLPDFLLDAESIIKTLVQNEELTESFSEIEVIGWLYQYYIAEEKDRVFAQKSKYKKEEIPFATQLFTPKWIVQYMVQNSLGRYWTEAHREDEDLINNWEYFIKHEEEDFHEKISPYVNKELKVEDIKLLDPAMGSGHILVYAFEVFHEIYGKCGYPERDIPRLILENNLYGLDIDDRAYQLAAFAVVMKATSYSKRFLRSIEREGIKLNLASIQETNHISEEVIAYIAQEDVGERYNQVKAFFEQYYNAKTYGSLINIKEREITFIEERLEQIANNPVHDLFYGEQHEIVKQVLPALIHQTKIMRNEYDVVVMNPPYMGLRKMSESLSNYLSKEYPLSKIDLFAAFLEVEHYRKSNGIHASINQHSWMFLSTFSNIRKKVLEKYFIDSMLHLGARAFEEVNGEIVQTTTFILRNYFINEVKGKYYKLVESKNPKDKEKDFLVGKNSNYYLFSQNKFKQIPDNPIVYWVPESIRKIFRNTLLEEYTISDGQNKTGNNDKYMRYFWEVDKNTIGKDKKWLPYAKGGGYRKWYGNLEHIVNWSKEAREHYKKDKISRIIPEYLWYKKGITWGLITTNAPSFRVLPEIATFDVTGSSIFLKDDNDLKLYLGILNSNLYQYIAAVLNPTISLQVKDVRNMPIANFSIINRQIIEEKVLENIQITKEDWDYKETSLDFVGNPICCVSNESNLAVVYENYLSEIAIKKNMLNENSNIINRIINQTYGISSEEISPITPKYDLEFLERDLLTEVKSIMSYFIGCLFGRYYHEKINFEGKDYINFSEKGYLENDIITLFRKFLNSIFSPVDTDKNLYWIAEALEMKSGEDAESRIRRYFMDEFFTDHCKMYQKRPIYWLVDSGKQKGLRTLIYMHRYTPSTMATIRFEHLQEMQAKYQQEIVDLDNRLVNPNLSAADKKKLNAEKVSFEKKIDELREFDKRLAEIAAEEIEIDLDDGVKVNYEKFYRGGKGVLAKIK
ncbi:BREX-1 system adenine-specific DNA-methyltransferase PglX [Lysinibacillus sp. KU-BSD001]|uniref:BREX-1 system adenine-specific DNA-methyltransferase PglX n=1 Tax=Lysinibacillus sp. KU-BSD001 TaxID=3141328 RepID=UPI0036E6430A